MLNLSRLSIMKTNTKINIMQNLFKFSNSLHKIFKYNSIPVKFFTGKTETGWKYTTPTMRMKSIKPIFPPPGDNLVIPRKLILIEFYKLAWTPKSFCERIGGDCHEVADKFENIQEIFTISSVIRFNFYL
jgi:hypothetical protein